MGIENLILRLNQHATEMKIDPYLTGKTPGGLQRESLAQKMRQTL